MGDYSSYEEAYKLSLENPEKFWSEAAEKIHWFKKWDKVLDDSGAPYFYKWFPGGKLNTSYLALDYHVENGRGDQIALIYDSPVTNTIKKYTYKELKEYVEKFAGVLKSFGVEKGDRVIIYMPMIPEAVVAMLATARLGAIHSVVFGGFAARELAVRINDAMPKLIVSASCGIEPKGIIEYKPLLDQAIELSEYKPKNCIIYQREQLEAPILEGRDYVWQDVIKDAEPAPYVEVDSTDPLYILYTSGTTGAPKGVVRDNGGHAVALRWSMENIYGVKPGDVFWAASDVGWVVGHSYIVYGPLITGCTTILFEGKPVGTPDAGVFWRVISEHKVKVLFTAPTAFRAIKKEDPEGKHLKKYDISHFKYLFLAGERLDPDTYHWATDLLKVPVIDHWWQTETGWPVAANCVGIELLPIKPGSPTKPVPGYDVRILDNDGNELPRGEEGIVVIKLPLPPGTLMTLWGNDERFKEAYLKPFPGYYLTGDGGYFDEDGYIYIMGRIDDIINVAGHRLSTGRMEEVVAAHPDVAECAVIGVYDEVKGEVPFAFFVLKEGTQKSPEDVAKEIKEMIRKQIGAIATLKDALNVKRLPKTRSGKILRRTLRKIVNGEEYKIPSTIDDPAILKEIEQVVKEAGYGEVDVIL